jgi:hypothetical protein
MLKKLSKREKSEFNDENYKKCKNWMGLDGLINICFRFVKNISIIK